MQYILRPVQTVRAVPCFPSVLKAFMPFCLENAAYIIFPTHLFPCRKEISFIFLLCGCLLILFPFCLFFHTSYFSLQKSHLRRPAIYILCKWRFSIYCMKIEKETLLKRFNFKNKSLYFKISFVLPSRSFWTNI